jgi:hypothetical protein
LNEALRLTRDAIEYLMALARRLEPVLTSQLQPQEAEN